MRGLKDGSPPAQSRGSSPVGVWGQSPQKLTTFSQNDANTSSTELLDNICSKKLFNISGGGASAPLPLPADAHGHWKSWLTVLNVEMAVQTVSCVYVRLPGRESDNCHVKPSSVQDPRLVPQQTEGHQGRQVHTGVVKRS